MDGSNASISKNQVNPSSRSGMEERFDAFCLEQMAFRDEIRQELATMRTDVFRVVEKAAALSTNVSRLEADVVAANEKVTEFTQKLGAISREIETITSVGQKVTELHGAISHTVAGITGVFGDLQRVQQYPVLLSRIDAMEQRVGALTQDFASHREIASLSADVKKLSELMSKYRGQVEEYFNMKLSTGLKESLEKYAGDLIQAYKGHVDSRMAAVTSEVQALMGEVRGASEQDSNAQKSIQHKESQILNMVHNLDGKLKEVERLMGAVKGYYDAFSVVSPDLKLIIEQFAEVAQRSEKAYRLITAKVGAEAA